MGKFNWFGEFLNIAEEARKRHDCLQAAWNEYDKTVDGLVRQKKIVSPPKYMEQVANKHGFTTLELREWYSQQPKD